MPSPSGKYDCNPEGRIRTLGQYDDLAELLADARDARVIEDCFNRRFWPVGVL